MISPYDYRTEETRKKILGNKKSKRLTRWLHL